MRLMITVCEVDVRIRVCEVDVRTRVCEVAFIVKNENGKV